MCRSGISRPRADTRDAEQLGRGARAKLVSSTRRGFVFRHPFFWQRNAKLIARTASLLEPSEAPQKSVLQRCCLPFPPSRGCQRPPGRPGSWPSSPAGCQRPSIFSHGFVLELDKIFQTNNWIVKGFSCHRTVWEGRGGKEGLQPRAAGPGAAAQPPPPRRASAPAPHLASRVSPLRHPCVCRPGRWGWSWTGTWDGTWRVGPPKGASTCEEPWAGGLTSSGAPSRPPRIRLNCSL